MKLAFISAVNPQTDTRHWSGCTHHLYAALARQVETVPLVVTAEGPPAWQRSYFRLWSKVTGRHSSWGLRPAVLQGLGRRAAEAVEGVKADAALAIGQGYLVFWQSAVPAGFMVDVLYGAAFEKRGDWRLGIGDWLNRGEEKRLAGFAQQSVDRAAKVFVTSEDTVERAGRRLGTRIPAGKKVITQIGANFDGLPTGLGPRQALPPLRLLWVGTNWEGKGGEDCLAVLDGLRAAGVEAELHMAGRVPAGVEQPGMTYHGFLRKEVAAEREQLLDLYRQAHLILHPTRADRTPCALAEAAAMGVPAVASRIGGIPGMFGEGEIVLLEVEEYREKAVGVIRELVDGGRLGEMAERVRGRYERELNWDVIAGRIVGELF